MVHLEELFLRSCKAVISDEMLEGNVDDIASDGARLLLPSYVNIVVQLSGIVFSYYGLKVKVDASGRYHCNVSLFYRSEDAYTLLGTAEGRGPSALNLAYMRAVILLSDSMVQTKLVEMQVKKNLSVEKQIQE
jgi:hypothetical protein